VDDILSDLNEAQREAVVHGEGPLLVVAGAGSGKTRVITRRIAWLVRGGLDPAQVLAITFTNKAAGEMRERVARLLGRNPAWISTFHALGARFLRMEARAAGLDPNFTIFDATDQVTVLRELLKSPQLARNLRRDIGPQDVRAYVSERKNAGHPPADPEVEAGDDPFEAAYRAYEEMLRSCEAVDFDDLLLRPVRMLEQDEGLLRRFASRFRTLLVDEYQDTNVLQHRLARLLAEAHGNICATGDPDQSIYGWRGAEVANILEFEQVFPGARVIKLEENYRSTNAILRAASALIRNNTERIDRELWSRLGEGERPVVWESASESEEALRVVDGIVRATQAGFGLDDVAVFYRTNACSRPLEQAFRLANVPYAIVGALEFYERREVKDLLAYLRVIANPADAVDLLRIVNVPGRGIGARTIERIRAHAAATGRPLRDVFLAPAGIPDLRGAARKALDDFAVVLATLLDAPRTPVVPVLDRVLELTAYRDWLRHADDPLREERLENVEELRRAIAEYDAANPFGDLDEFVRETVLLRSRDEAREGEPRATLMTLHSAKGLEYPVVFVCALEEGVLPHVRSMVSQKAIEEERRLMYVGMTRAQRRLVLSFARSRGMSGSAYGRSIPSRFLAEIPDALLDGAAPTRPTSHGADECYEPDLDGDEPPFHEGDMVVHDQFGRGVVLRLSGFGPAAKVTVDFEAAGEKRLILEYAKLRKPR
jgi:DNA helicase-2/ATP-dependent DNA helicase PcrA